VSSLTLLIKIGKDVGGKVSDTSVQMLGHTICLCTEKCVCVCVCVCVCNYTYLCSHMCAYKPKNAYHKASLCVLLC